MKTFNEPVPNIDFSRLLEGQADAQAADTIHRACFVSGFFYLSNFGIGKDKIALLEDAMQWFFALPQALKQSVARNEENSRGYYNNELTKNTRDMKEVFDFGVKINPDMYDSHLGNHTQDGWNQWPQ